MYKIKWYSIKKLLKVNAKINILEGVRSNGKSTAISTHFMEDYKKNKHKFVYIRRFKEDMKIADLIDWLNQCHPTIEEIFEGKYNWADVYQGKIYLYNLNKETGEKIRGEHIGRYCVLSAAESYKSGFSDANYYNIVMEEFISERGYIYNEPNKLMDLISTILRQRDGRVYLIGNNISDICPYYDEWELYHVDEQPMNSIEVYPIKTIDFLTHEEITTHIAVEKIDAVVGNAGFYVGKKARQMAGLSNTDRNYPLSNNLGPLWQQIHTIYIIYERHCLALDLMLCKNHTNPNKYGSMCILVRNSFRLPKETENVLTIEFTPYRTWLPHLPNNKLGQLYYTLLKNRKVVFKNGNIGQKFYQINEMCGFFDIKEKG